MNYRDPEDLSPREIAHFYRDCFGFDLLENDLHERETIEWDAIKGHLQPLDELEYMQ